MSEQVPMKLEVEVQQLAPSEQALHNNFTTSYRSLTRDLVRTAYYLHQIQECMIYRKLGFDTIGDYAQAAVGLTPAQARDFVLLGRNLPRFPEVEKALDQGRLSWSQARLITRRVDPQDQSLWVSKAQAMTVKQLEEALPRVRGPILRLGASSQAGAGRHGDRAPEKIMTSGTAEANRGEGPGDTNTTAPERAAPPVPSRSQYVTLRFDPEDYARFERLLAGAQGADKEEKILRALAGAQGKDKVLPYLLVIMNCPVCGRGAIPSSRGEVPAPAALLKAAQCDAAIEDAAGLRRRTIPPRVRRQALQRARFRCEAEGCGHTQFLEVHHRVPVAGGGGHDLENLVVLCWRCHRRLHEQEDAARSALKEAPV